MSITKEQLQQFEFMESFSSDTLPEGEIKKWEEELRNSPELVAEMELNHIINLVLKNEDFDKPVLPKGIEITPSKTVEKLQPEKSSEELVVQKPANTKIIAAVVLAVLALILLAWWMAG